MPQPPRHAGRRLAAEWGLLFLVLLVIASGLVAWRWHEHAETGRVQSQRLQNQARSLSQHLDLVLLNVAQVLRLADAVPHESLAPGVRSAATTQLNTLNAAAAVVRSLQVLGANGRLLTQSNGLDIADVVVRQPCFERARRETRPGTLITCAPFRTPTGAWSVTFVRARQTAGGAFDGVVAASLDLDFLIASLPSALYAADMRAFVMQPDGIVIASSQADAYGTGSTLSHSPGALVDRFVAASQAEGIVAGRSVFGDSRVAAFQYLKPDGVDVDGPLLLAVSRSLPAVYRDWTLTNWISAVVWLLVAGASAVALRRTQRLRRSLTDEVSKLRRARVAELERLELIVGGADLSLWVWYVASRHLEIDARWCAMVGAPPTDLAEAARSWRRRLHPDDVDRLGQVSRLRPTDGVMQFEYRLRHDDGHWVWLLGRGKVVECDAEGEPVRVAGTNIDITERKHVERALKDSEAQLRLITDALPLAVARYDLERRFLFANRAHERTRGLPPEALIGRTLAEVYGADAVAAVEPYTRRVEAGEQLSFESEVGTARAGHRRIAVTLVPDFDVDGKVRGHFSITADVTERHALEQHLRDSQKMDSIGTLAGGIAHDFNNVLGAIVGHAGIALQQLDPAHAARTNLAQIRRAGQRARNLVQKILTFSRHEPQQLVTQALQPLLDETLELLRSTLPARVELVTEITDTPLYVSADATQIQQLLMNLGTNAWHALTADVGRIVIGLEELALVEGRMPSVDLAAGRHAHLWVRDNGIGMDVATQQRVFEPFFTTKPVSQGTGLGLSVVHGIVKTHRGAITVNSAPGRGTTFHVYLPAPQRLAPPHQPRVDEADPTRGLGQHVMVVDDDEVITTVVEPLLARVGYRVTIFHDARQALAAFAARPGDFDIVVTDYNMPELSGLELAAALLRLRPGLPIAISSGYLSDELRAGAQRLGIRHLMPKQNTFEELARLVQRVLADTVTAP